MGMEPSDADWLGHLFGAHSRAIRAYAWRRVQPDLVDDIVAEVFGVAWRERRRVPDDRPLPWLYRTASHVISHHHRATVRRANRERRASEPPVVSDQSDAVADAVLVTRALADLDHADAEVLRLAYWEDLPPSDIAVVLGCTPGAARTRLHRARSRLRDILGEADELDQSGGQREPDDPREPGDLGRPGDVDDADSDVATSAMSNRNGIRHDRAAGVLGADGPIPPDAARKPARARLDQDEPQLAREDLS